MLLGYSSVWTRSWAYTQTSVTLPRTRFFVRNVQTGEQFIVQLNQNETLVVRWAQSERRRVYITYMVVEVSKFCKLQPVAPSNLDALSSKVASSSKLSDEEELQTRLTVAGDEGKA